MLRSRDGFMMIEQRVKVGEQTGRWGNWKDGGGQDRSAERNPDEAGVGLALGRAEVGWLFLTHHH